MVVLCLVCESQTCAEYMGTALVTKPRFTRLLMFCDLFYLAGFAERRRADRAPNFLADKAIVLKVVSVGCMMYLVLRLLCHLCFLSSP